MLHMQHRTLRLYADVVVLYLHQKHTLKLIAFSSTCNRSSAGSSTQYCAFNRSVAVRHVADLMTRA
jgi:hypothetical protein